MISQDFQKQATATVVASREWLEFRVA